MSETVAAPAADVTVDTATALAAETETESPTSLEAETAPTGEEVTEPTKGKDKKPDPEAAALEAAAKEREARKARLEKAKSDLAKRNAETKSLREWKMRSQQELQNQHAQIQAERQARTAAEARLAKMKGDPLSAFEELGIKPDELGKKILEESTPEAASNRVIRELQARLEAFEKAQKESVEREQQARQAQQIERARTEFINQATNVEQYPHLARVAKANPGGIIREAEAILQDAFRRTGQHYTDAEVSTYLNQLYSKVFEDGASTKEAAAAAGKSKATETATTAATASNPAPKLTNKATASKATIPENIGDMDPVEAKKAMTAYLEQLVG